MTVERDYVLGTHDAEIARLGLQHAVWRPRALRAWQRAGFTTGQRIADIGCGPGYASLDLADIVGARGEVIGLDRSGRFLAAAAERARERSLDRVTFVERDLDEDAPLPVGELDGAWCRWVFAFVQRPRELLTRIRDALKPGGRLVVHEYFDYSTWRLAPRSDAFERFVQAVMASWRAAGGEPDIGLSLPAWLADSGFDVASLRNIVDAVRPADFIWQWPAAFAREGAARLVDSGHLTAGDADRVLGDLDHQQSNRDALMITPGVLEIIATRR